MSRCKHTYTRCIHGDENWARMKTYPFRFWKESVIRRQSCLCCRRALDRGPICTRFEGQHMFAGEWDEAA